MKNLSDINIEKSCSGVYKDNSENRRLHRVGQRYGNSEKGNEERIINGKDSTPKNGVYLYPVRKDGSKYAKPSFYEFYGNEKTAEDVIARLEELNPGKKFVKEGRGKGSDVTSEMFGSLEGKPEVKYEDYEGEDEDGELVTFTYDKDKFDRYQLYRLLRAARFKRWTDPSLSELGYLKNSGDLTRKAIEKYFELEKEFGDGRKYDFKEKNQGDEKKGNGVKEEKFSRVNLPDIPNAHKVNLAKYLSAKRKKAVDDAWGKVKFDSPPREKAGVFQEGYNKLREQFNNNFDDMSKSERAELLYKILKMKNAMERK